MANTYIRYGSSSGGGGGGSGGSGTVTQVNTGTGLVGGPITTSGTISVASVSLTNQVVGNLPLSQTSGSISLSTQTSGQISLTSQVSGTLGVGNGGTGNTSANGNSIIFANGAGSAFTTSTNFLYDGSAVLTFGSAASPIVTNQIGQYIAIKGTNDPLPGELRLGHSYNTNYVGFRGPQGANPASSFLWELPAADGTSGQVLRTNGVGSLSFVSIPSLNTNVPIKIISSTYSVNTATDYILLCNTASDLVVINLPSAPANQGYELEIRDIVDASAHNINIIPNGSDTIFNASNVTTNSTSITTKAGRRFYATLGSTWYLMVSF